MNSFQELFNQKISEANKLIDVLQSLSNVKGISKLKKLVIAERTFLLKMETSEVKDAKHLLTTNLTHFDALISTILEMNDCVSVLEPFTFQVGENSYRIVVDIVRNEGKEWIKVTARNPKGLMISCLGDSTFGSRTLIDQAKDFVKCASQNKVFYVPPKVIFKFCFGVDSSLATKISDLGIEVVGDLLPTCYSTYCNSSDEELGEEKKDEGEKSVSKSCEDQDYEGVKSYEIHPVLKLNLDITALIAYVSDMTNGGTCLNFIQEPLTLQAHSEKDVKVKENLDKLFQGKELYSCETAVTRFKEIIEVVGGENEKKRAKDFLDRVTVVPDCISERVKTLRNGGQIKERPKVVFGTGDTLQAVTVSANWGFCRSAQHQRVQLATFLHQPRALSEQASQCSIKKFSKICVE